MRIFEPRARAVAWQVAVILLSTAMLFAPVERARAQTLLAAEVVTGQNHTGGPGFVVARTAAEYAALKSRIGRDPGPFEPGAMVAVAVFRGEAGDGTYGLRVTQVERSGLILKITFVDLKPADGKKAAIKRPYAVVLVRGRFKHVRLFKAQATRIYALPEKPAGQVLRFTAVTGRKAFAVRPDRNAFIVQSDRRRWQDYVEGGQDPAFIDGKHMGVILKIGSRPNRSYALEIARVVKVGEKIIVYYRERRRAGPPVLKVGHLLKLLRIDGMSKEIDFREVR